MLLCKQNYLTPKEVISLWSSSTVSIAAKGCTEAGTHKVSDERSRTRILGKVIIQRVDSSDICIWVSFCRTGKMIKLCLKKYFLPLHCDQTVRLFQLFSTVLKRFCPWYSKKNVFVLVPHLEPELEL